MLSRREKQQAERIMMSRPIVSGSGEATLFASLNDDAVATFDLDKCAEYPHGLRVEVRVEEIQPKGDGTFRVLGKIKKCAECPTIEKKDFVVSDYNPEAGLGWMESPLF